jgi:hypothetical protein
MALRWQAVILAPAVLGGSAGVLLSILAAVEYPLALTVASAVGCYGASVVMVALIWAVIAVATGHDDHPPSWLTFMSVLLLIPGLLAWGLFYVLHVVIGSSGIIRMSEGAGCLVGIFAACGAFGAVLDRREWHKSPPS